MTTLTRRGRIVALVVAVLVVLVAVVAIARAIGGGDPEPPATGAAEIAPASTPVLVDVSTAGDRAGVQHAAAIL